MERYEAPEYDQAVAIIGMAGVYSLSPNLDAFWHNIATGYEAVRFMGSDELRANGCPPRFQEDPAFVPASATLDEEAFHFDAEFFGFTPAEARIMDPQLRLMLQTAWHAFEDALLVPGRDGGLTGVFAGGDKSDYLLCHLGPEYSIQTGMRALGASLFNGPEHLSSWISYKFGLTGPSLNIQTACSTGLVAVSSACQNLLDYSCDTALAVAGAVFFPRHWGYLAEPGSIVSQDGHCRPFDAGATGTITGEGVGALVLKRLHDAVRDGDRIRGVIRGFAINNDGSSRAGFSAPGVAGQVALLTQALASAQVLPDDVGYIEAHGTGTHIGDPIEFTALKTVYGRRRGAPRLLGSVKANIGHLGACAGMVSIHKLLLMLQHGRIPPQINFSRPNPEIDLDGGGFAVSTELIDWPSDLPKTAAVSSFGLGGTNCHLILEGPPLDAPQEVRRSLPLPLCLSAVSEQALARLCSRWTKFLQASPEADLPTLAAASARGRKAFPWRVAVAAQSRQQALTALSAPPRFVHVEPDVGKQKTVLVFADAPVSLERLAPLIAGDARPEVEAEGKRNGVTVAGDFEDLLRRIGLRPDLVAGAGHRGSLAAALVSKAITPEEAAQAADGNKIALSLKREPEGPVWVCTPEERKGIFPLDGAAADGDLERKLALCLEQGGKHFLVIDGTKTAPALIKASGASWLPLGFLLPSADQESIRDILQEWLASLFVSGVPFLPESNGCAAATVCLPPYPFEVRQYRLDMSPANFCAMLYPESQGTSLANESGKKLETGTEEYEVGDILGCLCEIWNEALGVEDITPEDDFFQRGGTSIAAVTILTDIKNRTGLSIPMQDLLHLKTINGVLGRLVELAREDICPNVS